MDSDDQRKSRWAAWRELSAELRGSVKNDPRGLASQKFTHMLSELQDYQHELEQTGDSLQSIINELQASHKRYSDLYGHAPASYLTLSTEYLILEANVAACTLFGLEKKQLLGRMVTDFISPDTQPVFASHVSSHLDSAGELSCELKMHGCDGRVFETKLTSVVHPYGDEGDIHIWAILSDISQSKRDALIMQNYAHSQGELNKLLQLAIEDISTGDLYQRFLEEVLSFTRLGSEQQGLLFLVENDLLVLKAHKNITLPQIEQCAKIAVDSCLCGKAVAEKQVVFAPSTHLEHDRFSNQGQPHVHYCVPILTSSGEAIGCLTLQFNKNTKHSAEVEGILVASAQVIASIIRKKRTEEKLHERRELLASIYSAADSIGLIVTELEEDDARIIRFSPGAEKMFGYHEEEVLGKSMRILYRDEDRGKLSKRLAKLRRGIKVQSIDRIMRRKNGRDFPVDASLTPLTNNGGKTLRALGIYNDISKLKKVQQELEQAKTALEMRVEERTRDLQLAQQQVLHAEKLAAIGQLSASIAHEFNNPLQSVMSVLMGVSRRAKLEEEDSDLVESALAECSRMAHLIRDLQDFNRPSSGRQSWVNLHQVVDSLLLLCKSDFRKKNIELVRNYSDDLPAISVVSDQIRQVILNLLNNAIDACDQGCVISVETRTVPTGVQLTIRDNGCGIEPEHLPKVFEPFFTTKSDAQGTGLGLSVCHGIVQNHHGSIDAESHPGQGTSFTVTLPVKGKK